MTIPRAKINATITKIERPQHSGPGGDVVLHTLLEGELDAIREGVDRTALAGYRLNRDIDGEELLYDATFWVDLEKSPDAVRDIRAGDVLSWRSNRRKGPNPPADERATIFRATIWEAPGTVHENIEIFTRGDGNP